MSPAELKKLNIKHFEQLLESETDAQKRAMIKHLLAEERAKDDGAYPVETPSRHDGGAN
jgi:hypothetical protein